MKKPTLKEKVEVYEALFYRLHLHRYLTMDEKRVMAVIKLIDQWVESHNDHNGERADKDIDTNVLAAFERMKTLP